MQALNSKMYVPTAKTLYWHGIPDMVASKNKYETFIWTCIMIIAFAGLAFETYHVIYDYILQPFVIQLDPIYLRSQRIPDTVICPQEPFDTMKLRAHNFTQHEIAQLYQVFTPDYYTVPKGYVQFDSTHDPEGKIHAMNLTWVQFLEEFGITCKSLLKNCMINWKFVECCDVAEPTMHRYFGRCFALKNMNRFNNQTASFHFGGLVVLAINEPPKGDIHDPYGPITQGLSVEIAHNYESNTYEIFNIPSNEMVELALTAENYVRHEDRAGGCLNWQNWQSRMTPHYCWNKGVMDFCNCSLIGYKNDQDKSLCFPTEYANCNKDSIDAIKDKCENEMARPICNEWIYTCSVKSTKLAFHNYHFTQRLFNFSSEWRPDNMQSSLEDLKMNESYSLIAVYFTQMGFTEIKETSTYSIHRFISSVGGQLSLFLGASLISLAQLCIFSCVGSLQKKTTVDVSPLKKPVEAPETII